MTEKRTVFVIAEAGVNHNGDISRAHELIDAAQEAGADAVKFQTFSAAQMILDDAPKAAYQIASTGDAETQSAMIEKLELRGDEFVALSEHAKNQGIEFMSTTFDAPSVALLSETIGVRRLKVSSGDLTNGPLLHVVARTGKPIILSTGMSTLDEVEAALQVIAHGCLSPTELPSAAALGAAFAGAPGRAMLARRVTLLHCTTEYPAPFHEINLRAMDTLARAFELPIGYSDHTTGIAVALAAVARGACVIEKHLTLDRQLPGPDHAASLEPTDFAEMVRQIRQIEEALGNAEKAPSPSEIGRASCRERV